QLIGQFCQLSDGLGGCHGTCGGLRRNLLNHVHGVGDMAGGGRLLACRVRDVLNQVGQVLRYVLDLFQGHTGVLGQTSTPDHFRGGVLHGDNGFVGVGLNRLHQCLDLLGGSRGTFCQALYFVGNHREAAARVTGHGGLDGGVQRQNVGLVGNVVNQRYRSEEHTSELQSRENLVCRLLLEKKKKQQTH